MQSQMHPFHSVVNKRFVEDADKGQFFRNLALFYLKLQTKLLLPSSTIQTIIEDYQEMHAISQSHLLFKLKEKLLSLGLPDADIGTVIDTLKSEDLFRACNTQTLQTDHRRKILKQLQLCYPVSICLGQNESGKECFAQYIPVKNTLESLLLCKSVWEQHKQIKTTMRTDEVLQDVWDGTNIEGNMLFKNATSSLGVILYQDSFELVNPLGSRRKKHKILAVYMTLANILPHNRSSIDQIQLVLLCQEQDFWPGPCVWLFCERSWNKWHYLADGQICKVHTVLAALLRVLAGPYISAGIVRLIDTHFWQILLPKVLIAQQNHIKSMFRLRHTMSKQVLLEVSNLTQSLMSLLTFMFASLDYLPVLAMTFLRALFPLIWPLINYFVTKEKHFSYLELNRRINQFKYLGNDSSNKPCKVNPGTGKLSGLVFSQDATSVDWWQNKKTEDSEVWQLILQLREIVDLVCAPIISTGQIAYLQVLIEEYLQIRKETFGDHPLKPKHQYLCHYPELIVQFGPLIRLWKLWFESKHTYFKQRARKLHNFRNLCQTLAERHQLCWKCWNSLSTRCCGRQGHRVFLERLQWGYTTISCTSWLWACKYSDCPWCDSERDKI